MCWGLIRFGQWQIIFKGGPSFPIPGSPDSSMQMGAGVGGPLGVFERPPIGANGKGPNPYKGVGQALGLEFDWPPGLEETLHLLLTQ